MKKAFLILAALVFGAGTALAQNYMVVDSEKVFKSIAAYNSALAEVEADAERYQTQIDDAFDQLEQTFNTYQQRKGSMTASARAAEEQRIVAREEEINKFQADTFGEEGTLFNKRVGLIKPIQDRVFAAIEAYAADHGYDIVMDKASNPTLLYHNPRVDHTDAIIAIVK
ncbi:MAG: OmpH family outer membrane protein [Alistipes sp.]|jgi:outer membrane protein|nr:OmpH family outer membrane protein [Alistipes sp.]